MNGPSSISSRHWPVVFAFVALAAVLLAGCGGGGSSANGESVGAAELLGEQRAEAQRHPHKKHKTKKLEQLEQKEHERFLEEEENRIIQDEEEAAAEKRKHRQRHARQSERKAITEPEPEQASSDVATITAEEFHGFNTEPDHGNWEIAYGVCAVTPEKQLAKEFHTEQNFGAIGHAYGSEYREPFNIAAEEGCMAALVDSEAQREAAFKMMEENE